MRTEGLSPARWVRGGGGRGVCCGTVAPCRDAGGQSRPPRAEARGIPEDRSYTSLEWATSWEDDGVAVRTNGNRVKTKGTHSSGPGTL